MNGSAAHRGTRHDGPPHRYRPARAPTSSHGTTSALAHLAVTPGLPWTLKHANLLIDGADRPRSKGTLLLVGGAILEINGEAEPCKRMDEQHAGLMAALAPNRRGGFTARVVRAGSVTLVDEVQFAPRA